MIKRFILGLLLILNVAGCYAIEPVKISLAFDKRIHVKGLTLKDMEKCLRDAEKAWEDVANVDFYYSQYPDLLIVSEPLIPGRVAECDIPAGKIRFDGWDAVTGLPDNRWTKDFFTRVMIHELGHALGLDHVSARLEPDSVMKSNQPLPHRPGKGDIYRLKQMYGSKDY